MNCNSKNEFEQAKVNLKQNIISQPNDQLTFLRTYENNLSAEKNFLTDLSRHITEVNKSKQIMLLSDNLENLHELNSHQKPKDEIKGNSFFINQDKNDNTSFSIMDGESHLGKYKPVNEQSSSNFPKAIIGNIMKHDPFQEKIKNKIGENSIANYNKSISKDTYTNQVMDNLSKTEQIMYRIETQEEVDLTSSNLKNYQNIEIINNSKNLISDILNSININTNTKSRNLKRNEIMASNNKSKNFNSECMQNTSNKNTLLYQKNQVLTQINNTNNNNNKTNKNATYSSNCKNENNTTLGFNKSLYNDSMVNKKKNNNIYPENSNHMNKNFQISNTMASASNINSSQKNHIKASGVNAENKINSNNTFINMNLNLNINLDMNPRNNTANKSQNNKNSHLKITTDKNIHNNNQMKVTNKTSILNSINFNHVNKAYNCNQATKQVINTPLTNNYSKIKKNNNDNYNKQTSKNAIYLSQNIPKTSTAKNGNNQEMLNTLNIGINNSSNINNSNSYIGSVENMNKISSNQIYCSVADNPAQNKSEVSNHSKNCENKINFKDKNVSDIIPEDRDKQNNKKILAYYKSHFLDPRFNKNKLNFSTEKQEKTQVKLLSNLSKNRVTKIFLNDTDKQNIYIQNNTMNRNSDFVSNG